MPLFGIIAVLIVLALCVAGSGAARRRLGRIAQKRGTLTHQEGVPLKHQHDGRGFTPNPTIEPLPNFDLETTEVLKFRPFKSIYHITMALQAGTPSDLIIIDTNYKERIAERRVIMNNHSRHVMGTVPEGHSAVQELYTYLLHDYLPVRYPTLFSTTADGMKFQNHITGAQLPLEPPCDPLVALRSLGETVEDDIFLVHGTEKGHRMVAFVCCFPSGFDPSSKLGKVLKDIHEPVPSYEKIGPSMERYFSRLEVGKSVKRINWSVTTQLDLFNLRGNHINSVEEATIDEDIDINTARVRMEFQTLTRLPKTNAILFSFKTYLYPVKDIKEEGLGPQFADAIEGLKLGNAPGMWIYKGGIRWGKSVCEYLRS